jgi:hypothetical protein
MLAVDAVAPCDEIDELGAQSVVRPRSARRG